MYNDVYDTMYVNVMPAVTECNQIIIEKGGYKGAVNCDVLYYTFVTQIENIDGMHKVHLFNSDGENIIYARSVVKEGRI